MVKIKDETKFHGIDPNKASGAIASPKILSKERYQIGIDYPAQKQDRLKKFCSIINEPVSIFTAQALDNEIQHRLECMDKKKRQAIENLM